MSWTAIRMNRNELPQMTDAAANSNGDFRVTVPGLPGLTITNQGTYRTDWLSARPPLQLGAELNAESERQAAAQAAHPAACQRRGFEALWTSDHLHPWLDEQEARESYADTGEEHVDRNSQRAQAR